MFKPVEADFARTAIWFGIAVLAVSHLMQLEHLELWFWLGLFFVVLGRLLLPKHPEHYKDYTSEDD